MVKVIRVNLNFALPLSNDKAGQKFREIPPPNGSSDLRSVSRWHSWRIDMSDTSSSSSSSGRVTKLTAAGKVPARHFMDIPAEEEQPRKRANVMRILAAVAISAVVMAVLAALAVRLYHQEDHKEEEILPEVKNFVSQRISDAKGLWVKLDMSEYKDYITGFFTNKKYVIQVTPEGTSFLDLFKWKKPKKFNVKIADL